MWFDSLIKQHMKAVRVALFDDDPEDDPDRAGDGWYYRLAGENEGWSGAWGWESEAIDEARADLERRYHEIELPRSFFRKRPPKGFSYFLATGTSAKSKLGYDPYALYWPQPIKRGRFAFTLLVTARTFRNALENVDSRLGDGVELTALQMVEGKLPQICMAYGLQDPDDIAKAEMKAALAQ